MIITCPNCGARYRLAATAIAENARMRCAACDHRWVAGAEAHDEMPTPEPALQAEVAELAMTEPAPEPVDETSRSAILPTMLAVVLGTALAIGAGAVWMARIDPALLPVVGGKLAALAPVALPLETAFTAQTTPLPSGDRLLEIKGRVRNSGSLAVAMPDLEARLISPAGATVRRWRITVPVAVLAPGETAEFASTATGFPTEATVVGIRPAG